ncbi:hypothetical protein LSCM4_06724 [Leishmania orientalis]|uniref:RING-type domain-containing protein n=1 Tax=Leishmania orientalis TaxID=2249476 RepID=A0A836HR28_9TRYP|nr:hypothetical protein LSCM4_06724 [Leishmania orientalis]
MSFLAREFRELEATSQLPPSTPQQHVAPSTVLLPATVGKLTPQLAAMAAVAGPVCASGVAVTMPQLSPSVARNVAAMTPQASIQMCMAPVLGFSPFSGSQVLDGGARLQVTTNGYPDARADRVCSGACNRSAMVPAHILPAAASAEEVSAFGPPTSASSTAPPRLSHSTAESLLMVNFTSAHHCTAEGTTPAMPEAITTGSGSCYTNRSDTCLTKRLSCSTASSYPHAQAPHQQMCQVCHAPMTRVLTPVLDPSDPVTPGVDGAASRGGLVHRRTPPFSAVSEGARAFHSLTSVTEPTAASATTLAMSSRSASHRQVNIGCPSTALEDGAPHQAPLSTATDTFSADSRTTACVPPSLQDRMASAAPATVSGGFGPPSSTLYVAPPPAASPCHSDSVTNRYPNAVGAKSSDGKSRGGGHTSASIAGTAMATAFASSRLPPSPASSATVTSPPPPSMRLSSSDGNDAHLHRSDSSAGNTSSTIAFVPIEVQPTFATAAPSFFATPACRSPAHAAVSAGEPAASLSALEAASAPPTLMRGLPSSSAALFTSAVPTMVALQQPCQASGGPREPTTPPLRQHPAPLATHPLQHTAYWSLPRAPAGTMTVILAAPEVNWHSLTGGRATTPASSAGAAASDPCGHTFIAGCSARGTETPTAGSCSSPASIATSRTVSPGMLTTSPASSAGLEAQRASGGRGATRTTAGQTYRSVLVHGGCGVGGRGGGANTGLTAPGSGYGLGLPLYSSQPQLLCTPVPLDDTESVCAICLEGRVSTTMTETAESTSLSSPPLQPPRAAEEESCQESDSGGGALSDLATADDSTFDEEVEHGTTRGVKPGSCLLSLPCGHCYHQNCVQRWLIESQSCPMCRRDLTRDATIS